MGDGSVMRNLASPGQLEQWCPVEGVPAGAIAAFPVWQEHCVLVLPTRAGVDERALDTVVSPRWCVIYLHRIMYRVQCKRSNTMSHGSLHGFISRGGRGLHRIRRRLKVSCGGRGSEVLVSHECLLCCRAKPRLGAERKTAAVVLDVRKAEKGTPHENRFSSTNMIV